MNPEPDHRGTALLLIGWLIAVSLPYGALIDLFGYDDVLREPPGVVLTRFAAAGEPLVWAWAGFAAAALAFAPLALRIERAAGLAPGWTGVASAFAQFLGLARWVFAVPALAALYGAGDAAQRAGAVAAYQALHGYLGAGVGEVLGQVLLIAWTARLAAKFWADGRRRLALVGAATLPLWVAGLSEPLGTVLPSLPLVETTPFAFMGWEAWLLAIAVVWLVESRRLRGMASKSRVDPQRRGRPVAFLGQDAVRAAVPYWRR